MDIKWVDLEGLRTFKELQDISNSSKYVTEEYVDEKIGDINSVLDVINGEVI